jgi:hypothetical protein
MSKTIKKEIKGEKIINIEISVGNALKIGEDLYKGLKRGVFSPHYFPKDTIEYTIKDEFGKVQYILKINLKN